MQTGLARLGGISLDSNGAPGQPGLICPCKRISPASRASIETLFNTKKKLVKMNTFLQNMLSVTAILKIC